MALPSFTRNGEEYGFLAMTTGNWVAFLSVMNYLLSRRYNEQPHNIDIAFSYPYVISYMCYLLSMPRRELTCTAKKGWSPGKRPKP